MALNININGWISCPFNCQQSSRWISPLLYKNDPWIYNSVQRPNRGWHYCTHKTVNENTSQSRHTSSTHQCVRRHTSSTHQCGSRTLSMLFDRALVQQCRPPSITRRSVLCRGAVTRNTYTPLVHARDATFRLHGCLPRHPVISTGRRVAVHLTCTSILTRRRYIDVYSHKFHIPT
jgi:hypothetical protein